MRLCRMFCCDVKKIRTIIGMNLEHLQWRTHFSYRAGRPRDIPIHLLADDCTISQVSAGIQCVFCCYPQFSRTVFVNKDITKGVFKWIVQVNYAQNIKNYFSMGAVFSIHMWELMRSKLGAPGTCAFSFSPSGSVLSRVHVKGPMVSSGSVVALEADATHRTLCFFVNGKKLPFAFSEIPVPLRVGISSSNYAFFTSLHFYRYPSAHVHTRGCCGTCRYYPCSVNTL